MWISTAYFEVLKFHQVDSGEVGEEQIQMYERSEAEIAPQYREITDKLCGVEVSPYEEPKDLPHFDESDALDELVRLASQEDQGESAER